MNVRPGQRAVIVRGACKGTKVQVIGPAAAYDAAMVLQPWWSCVSLGGPLVAHRTKWGADGGLCTAMEADIADEALRPLIDPEEIETIVVDDVLPVPRETEAEVLTR